MGFMYGTKYWASKSILMDSGGYWMDSEGFDSREHAINFIEAGGYKQLGDTWEWVHPKKCGHYTLPLEPEDSQ